MSKITQQKKALKAQQRADGIFPQKPQPALSQSAEEVARRLKEVGPNQCLTIRFRRESVGDVRYLLGMHRGGMIMIDRRDEAAVKAVVITGEWDNDVNRTVRLRTTEQFNTDWFVSRLIRRVEYVQIGF